MKSVHPLGVIASILLGLLIAGGIFFSHLNTTPSPYKGVKVVNTDSDSVKTETYTPEAKPVIKGGKKASSSLKTLDSVNHLFFNYHSKFLVWIFVFCILVGLSFGFILPLVTTISELKNRFTISKKSMRWSTVIAIFLLLFSLIIGSGMWLGLMGENGGKYHSSFGDLMEHLQVLLTSPKLVIGLLIICSSIGPAIAIRGIFVVNYCIQQLNISDKNSKSVKRSSKDFKLLQEKLDFFLLAVAIIVSGNGVTTGFGREALMQAIPYGHELLFPVEFVYLYGISFTFFLAIFYLPIRMQLKRKGDLMLEEFQEHLEKEELENSKSKDKEALKSKESKTYSDSDLTSLKAIFGMKASTNFDTAKVILSIMGPLLTTLAGKLLGF